VADCIFCEIVAGRATASVVYDDVRIMAFMTLHPTRPGEFVLVPKRHLDHFCDLEDDLSAHLCVVAQRLSRNLRERLAPKRVGWVVHGFGVPHAHLIVVPQHEESDIVSGRPPREELDRLAALRSSESVSRASRSARSEATMQATSGSIQVFDI
jgi:histidine triad (HIT) family protein